MTDPAMPNFLRRRLPANWKAAVALEPDSWKAEMRAAKRTSESCRKIWGKYTSAAARDRKMARQEKARGEREGAQSWEG